jgi:hypothetical protein
VEGPLNDIDDTAVNPYDPNPTMPEAVEQDYHTFDKYLTADIIMERGGQPFQGQVVQHKRVANGKPIGKPKCNSILDTREYDVEL